MTGKGPDGSSINVNPTTIHVKANGSDNWQPLNFLGLNINVASHSQGIYVTSSTNSALVNLVNYYNKYAIPLRSIPSLASQAASLPLGGLFDYRWNQGNAWHPPHCSHRDGRTIDISRSSFPAATFEHLENALWYAAFKSGFSIVDEGDHWHLHR